MVKFFRDVLSGPLYFIVAIVAIILIMAIIGFIMEKKQKEEEEESKIVRVGDKVKPINEDISEIPETSIEETSESTENIQDVNE